MTAPRGLGAAGRRLWREVTEEFEIDGEHLVLLEQAAEILDTIAKLKKIVAKDGLLIESHGGRAHPGLAEIRQQQLVYVKLIAALKLPTDDQRCAPQRTGRVPGSRGIPGSRGVLTTVPGMA